MSGPIHRVLFLVFALTALSPVAAEETLLDRARQAMARAGQIWATEVAAHGGYVWEYSTDLVTRRRGESLDLPESTCWVQPPGTPSVGLALLRAYEATGEAHYLDAAVAAAHCLAWGQLESGGWSYSIEFDRKRIRDRYHHLDPETTPGYDGLQNTSTFDDNNTQSATMFLIAVDRHVDDPHVDACLNRAIRCLLEAQFKEGPWSGAWPQRYPPPKGYGGLPTYNDDTMSDCVRTMLAAYHQYGKREYLEAVQRCLEFYLRSQLPEPQTAWAQQYDENLRPASARKFEPVAVTGRESAGNMQLLMDMYVEFGDQRYLDAVGRAVDWYRRSRIGGTEQNGIWARFYELGTNKPLYFTRTYELVYTDDDLPVHYAFKGNFAVNLRMHRYEALRKRGRAHELERQQQPSAPEGWHELARQRTAAIERIIAAQDARGRWVKTVAKREQVRDAQGRVGYVVDQEVTIPMMYAGEFVGNMTALAEYITAARGGPAATGD